LPGATAANSGGPPEASMEILRSRNGAPRYWPFADFDRKLDSRAKRSIAGMAHEA